MRAFRYETLDSLKAHLDALNHRLQLRQAPQIAALEHRVPGHLRRLGERPHTPHY
jgi:hypothetical protein